MNYFIGVDVGTTSARAALVSESGKVVKVATKNIQIFNYNVDFYEQSSEDVWNACLYCIKEVIKNVPPETIKGIGFDATCSLVVVDKNGDPLSVSQSGNNDQNIIMWLDHRASKEADEITAQQHDILRFVGGKISLEMETPKLKWLKTNLPKTWSNAGYFFDLPDYLTWRATSCDSRSLCSLVCKWTYEILDANNNTSQWNPSYFKQTCLEDLLQNGGHKIGKVVKSPGESVGNGLHPLVAAELDLVPHMPVGASIIDAHSGGLGLIGCQVDGVDADFSSRLSLICGTSTCHMAVSKDALPTPGIWGPYYSAMVPGMWLNEAGQSVTGKLIDFIIDSHPASNEIKARIGDMHIQEYLTKLLRTISTREKVPVDFLTKEVHVWPDFHGNRSPIADPTLKGMISGLTLSSTEENLAILYLATVQALCYGTRHIMETLVTSGYKPFKSILICGGLSKNPLYVQMQANTVHLPVVVPEEVESVLLGAAILGACAAGHFENMFEAISRMGGRGKSISPEDSTRNYHDKKYRVYKKMLEDQLAYRNIMNE
ncbi:FGGY carbohydrate kinase domain-containing protein-like [Atheta coriaria]|uniref:FGGY carbohydrate kinase domain-containing protein-like n=1 Tax=Dalotia coriaria TaxID=877792 RepID=UPI0031F398D9